MKYLLDTNILLSYPEILNDAEKEYVISVLVLQEIDRLKNSKNAEKAFEARKASHYILKNMKDLQFTLEEENGDLSIDDKLLKIAQLDGYCLISNDLNVIIKARIRGINYERYTRDLEAYSGIEYLEYVLDDLGYNEELEDLLQTAQPPEGLSLFENEFLSVTDEEENSLVDFIYKSGVLKQIDSHYIKNKYSDSVKPKNKEQNCLMELLDNQKISILLAQGAFGTGKSFLLINYALQQLEKGKIDKIVYVPNNSFTADTREIGALPGGLFEKEIIHMGTIIDILGGREDVLLDLMDAGQFEISPISTMRGRNFTNSIVIVNEAQNLTEDHIKLLVGRIGENSRIFFDGDIKQVDNSVFKNKNGLRLLTKLKDSPKFNPIFGTVKLVKVERSFTAQAADYLDEI